MAKILTRVNPWVRAKAGMLQASGGDVGRKCCRVHSKNAEHPAHARFPAIPVW